jgi:alkanesulfonate monooxygenase SsuD/methylene tetrahydromethanopterin reductase-like flavin-dependent oxidoreductase (luciferase family)
VDHGELYQTMLDQCTWADELGFDSVVFGEHHGTDQGYLPAATMAAAAVAGRTFQIKLRPMVMAPFRDPVHLAEELAVLDQVSGGRLTPIILGGYRRSEFGMFGASPKDRPRLLEECVETLKLAWTGEPFDFRGRRIRVTPRPFQEPRPTIVVGATSTAGARRAARIGDEFQAGEPGHWRAYVEECDRLGRDPGHRERSGPVFLYVTGDPERAWREVGPYVLHHVHMYGEWTREDLGYDSKLFPPAQTIEDLQRDAGYQVVTPEECVSLAARWHPDGALLFHPMMSGLPAELSWASLKLFEREVLPNLF